MWACSITDTYYLQLNQHTPTTNKDDALNIVEVYNHHSCITFYSAAAYNCPSASSYFTILSSKMVINLRAYWGTQRGTPFMNETIPILDIDNLTLASFIRREIGTHQPSINYTDDDITAVKSGSGSNRRYVSIHLII